MGEAVGGQGAVWRQVDVVSWAYAKRWMGVLAVNRAVVIYSDLVIVRGCCGVLM